LKLADYCESHNVPMIHLSTDCVFDGNSGLYVESDPTCAKDAYGQSKIDGEPQNAITLRTSIVGPEASNFYSLLCWFLTQENQCYGFTRVWTQLIPHLIANMYIMLWKLRACFSNRVASLRISFILQKKRSTMLRIA